MAEPDPRPRRRRSLCKQNSWSPDILREEAWTNRRRNNLLRRGRSSVTDDDVDELRGLVDLGFQFGSPDLDPKLSSTFPALEFYYAVNRNALSRSASFSDYDSGAASSSAESPRSIIDPGEDPETVKTRLRHWAQVVACSVRQLSP
ncbi:hypothetical protein PHJA_000601600 [Phtheirospermum japonicum]|uniref:Uncharacterized protein n=1 Tax=Phtheirospermum japonicum TaxID=374723 RepID=A0A830BBX9_9LAMI|nr:hypothetical protein PHJA_000601600 [Phtheirospermum japonicum]